MIMFYQSLTFRYILYFSYYCYMAALHEFQCVLHSVIYTLYTHLLFIGLKLPFDPGGISTH